jgi:hypothetical protein
MSKEERRQVAMFVVTLVLMLFAGLLAVTLKVMRQ